MIIGGSGSGKSTTARKLGDITGLPVIHFDQFYWQPGWVERPREDFLRLTKEATAADSWIIDGNYSGTFDDRLARADTIVFLDLPTWTRIRRVWWRTLTNYGRPRPDLGNACPERFDWEFLFRFVPAYHTSGARDRAVALLARTPAHITIHHLRTLADVREFMTEIQSASA